MVTLTTTIQTLKRKNGRYSPIIEFLQHGRHISTLTLNVEYPTHDEAYMHAYRLLGLDADVNKIYNNIKKDY